MARIRLACALLVLGGLPSCEGIASPRAYEPAKEEPAEKPAEPHHQTVEERLKEVSFKDIIKYLGLKALEKSTKRAREVVSDFDASKAVLGEIARKADTTVRTVGSLAKYAVEDFKTSNATAELRQVLQEGKKKLEQSSAPEILERLHREGERRKQEVEAAGGTIPEVHKVNTSSIMSLLRRGAKIPRVAEKLDEIKSNPGYKAVRFATNATGRLINLVNDAKSGKKEVGESIYDLLHQIPEEKGEKIKQYVLPFVAANNMLKDMPLSKTEKNLVNFGLAVGVLKAEDMDKHIWETGYKEGANALADLAKQQRI